MYDITALGELLIDFTECGKSDSGMRLFEQNPGGAVANMLCAAVRFGVKTCFIGKVGADMHGDFLQNTLEENGVCTQGLIKDPEVFTTLAFVSLSQSGERTFSFARKPGADTCLAANEVDVELLSQTRIFHVGSLSMTNQPAREATFFAVEAAKRAGAVISYDPNYRAPLWPGEAQARVEMQSLLPYVDMIKVSLEEAPLLTGLYDAHEAALWFNEKGIRCAVVTLGEKGAVAAIDGESVYSPAFALNTVDTTGAGDAFWGAFLYKCLENGVTPADITLCQAEDFLRFANASGALCTTRRGAIPALPTLAEVQALLAREC